MNFLSPTTGNIGNNPSNSIFTSYLINELMASGLYDNSLANKNQEERAAFKEKLIEIWFKALHNETHMTDGGLTFAITSLAAKRNWTDSQIKQLCTALNYDARKEIKDNPYSWSVFFKHKN